MSEVLITLSSIFLVIVIAVIVGVFLFIKIRNAANPGKILNLKNTVKSGNYKTAIKQAKEIIAKQPDNFDAHYYLGAAYDKEGKYELALVEYKAADKLGVFSKNINEDDLRSRLAELYLKFNKIEEALKEYALLAQRNPNDYYVYFKMGELFNLKNNKQQAVSYYLKSLKLKKDYSPTLYNLAIIYYDFKKFADAKKLLLLLKKLEPDNMKIFYYLGVIYKNEADYKNALAFLEKAMRDKEYKVKALAERGMIYTLMNKFEEASIEFERALKNIDGESQNFILNVRYILASCYESMRNITDAIKQWELIYSMRADFKNVADKLTVYQDIRMDDTMKDYMTATNEDFAAICKNIAIYYNFNIEDMKNIGKAGSEGVELLVYESNPGWVNLKKKLKIMRIYRKSEPIEEKQLREVVEIIKQKELFKGIIITSSAFSQQAVLFAQERPLELIDKNELQNILKNINL